MKYICLITLMFFFTSPFYAKKDFAWMMREMKKEIKERCDLLRDMSSLLRETTTFIKEYDEGQHRSFEADRQRRTTTIQ